MMKSANLLALSLLAFALMADAGFAQNQKNRNSDKPSSFNYYGREGNTLEKSLKMFDSTMPKCCFATTAKTSAWPANKFDNHFVPERFRPTTRM